MKIVLIVFLILVTFTSKAQISKNQVIKNINQWYLENPNKYSVNMLGEEATATITRYHPERPEEKNDLIEVAYKGMKVQLKFNQELEEITTHKDSLQKYFQYVSLENINHDIASKGWNISPLTPISSLRGKGVIFNFVDDSISFTINWSTYTVMGYKDSKKCRNQLSFEDGMVSEDCYVSVQKNLPFELIVSKVKLK
tara:strand:- start:61 stop:651 length:591 start_codon:yes stop_codon:yes gene_type:complete